jgi:hypothetical protein
MSDTPSYKEETTSQDIMFESSPNSMVPLPATKSALAILPTEIWTTIGEYVSLTIFSS